MLFWANSINDKWKFNIGCTAGTFGVQGNSIWGISDTILSTRVSQNLHSNISIRTGLERKIKTSIFSYGFNLALGYREYNQKKRNLHYHIDSTSSPLSHPTYLNSVYFNSYYRNYLTPLENLAKLYDIEDYFSKRTTKYFSTSIQFSLNADIPINKRFILALFSFYSLDIGFKINESNTLDPLNDLSNTPNILMPEKHLINFGVGLKYRINKHNTLDE